MIYIVRILKWQDVGVHTLSSMLLFDNEEKLTQCKELLRQHKVSYDIFEVGSDAINPDLRLLYRCGIALNGEIRLHPTMLSSENVPSAFMFKEVGYHSAEGYGFTPEEAIASAKEVMKREGIDAQSTK